MAESAVKSSLDKVKVAEAGTLLAKAEYVFATCKAIAETKDRSTDCEEFIDKIYLWALSINGDY